MSKISTVKLPVVEATDTIQTAIDRLKAGATSGVVVTLMDSAPLVIADWFLKNSLIANGQNRDEKMSDVARAAFPLPTPSSTVGKFFGRFTKSVQATIAPINRDYAVTAWDAKNATVSTDPKRAAELLRPSTLFDPIE